VVLGCRDGVRMHTSLACLAATLALGGCFNVQKVDPGAAEAGATCQTLLINDFEDHSGIANLPDWSRWTPYSYRSADGTGVRNAGLESSDDGSQIELFLDFALQDRSDGVTNDVGAGIAVDGQQTIDLTRYARLVFSMGMVQGNPPLPLGTQVIVELGCSQAPADRSSVMGDLIAVQGVAVATDVHRFALEIVNFGQPSWLTNHIKGGRDACLRVVDHLGFSIFPKLQDGQQASGKLIVDDIYLDNGVANGCPQ
jgi:hypothetical protein